MGDLGGYGIAELPPTAHCLRSEKKFHFDFDFFHFYLIESVIWVLPAMHPGD